jgi:prepilin-type N-terminal cleavage/methylation domain-containing protein
MCVLIKRRKGLTLLELIVVMTLLVLLAFVATPSFIGATRSAQLRTATQQLVAVFRYARAKAIAIGRPVLVELNRSERRVRVLLPAEVVQNQLVPTMPTVGGQSSASDVELSDEEWWQLAGERLETLNPNAFAPDPSPMGKERTLPEGVEIASVTDLTTGDELNLLAFYPDGSASGVRIVLQGPTGEMALEIAPLTGQVQTAELSTAARR